MHEVTERPQLPHSFSQTALGFIPALQRIADQAGLGTKSHQVQVGGDKVPTQGTTAGDKEGLCGGVGRLEQLACHGQGLTKDLDEAGSDMALTVVREKGQLISVMLRLYSMAM